MPITWTAAGRTCNTCGNQSQILALAWAISSAKVFKTIQVVPSPRIGRSFGSRGPFISSFLWTP